MNQLQTMINELGGNQFVMEFIEKKSPLIRALYLPSLLYTKESIIESTELTEENKIQALSLMDDMNDIVTKIFDLPQINLIMAIIINETIERMEKINNNLSKGKLLSLLLEGNRVNPTALTRKYELNEITRSVYTESLNSFIENVNGSHHMTAALENIFSYNLINKLCVDTIDLLDDYLFEKIEN